MGVVCNKGELRTSLDPLPLPGDAPAARVVEGKVGQQETRKTERETKTSEHSAGLSQNFLVDESAVVKQNSTADESAVASQNFTADESAVVSHNFLANEHSAEASQNSTIDELVNEASASVLKDREKWEEREVAMPDEEQDGDAEGKSLGEKKENEEHQMSDNSDVAIKRNNDDTVELETNDESVREFAVVLGNFSEIKEEEDDEDDDEETDEEEDNDDENKPRRHDEDKNTVWIRKIDEKETYHKVMAPVYLLLEVRSAMPLEAQQARIAVSHLSRLWPWWELGMRHRGKERTPWLCVTPQQPRLQVFVAHDEEDDEDEEDYLGIVENQQWRHKSLAGGMLCTVSLLKRSFSASPVDTLSNCDDTHVIGAAAPVEEKQNSASPTDVVCAVDGAAADTTNITATSSAPGSAGVPSDVTLNEAVPDLPHKVHLMFGIPRAFVDSTSTEVISSTLVTLLDDVLSGRIKEEYKPTQEPGSREGHMGEAERDGLQSWLEEKLQADVVVERDKSNADPVNECPQGEENESENRGYLQRTFDSVTSRNFINRCKAERVGYINGFATCVSTAAAALLVATEAPGQGPQVVTRQRVCEHLHWPSIPLEWQDTDPEEESPPESPTRSPGIIITAPYRDEDTGFWEAARSISRQRWEAPVGGRGSTKMQILHGLVSEGSDVDVQLQRYPTVSLRLCDIRREGGEAQGVQRAGDVVGLGPNTLTPLQHFLLTHTINLHLEENTQVLSFSLHHSTLFLSPGAGRGLADEIETALKTSLRCR